MKAKFKPKVLSDHPSKMNEVAGNEFNFDFAYELKSKEKYYTSKDLKFPTSNPINERDLEIL